MKSINLKGDKEEKHKGHKGHKAQRMHAGKILFEAVPNQKGTAFLF